MSMNDFDQNLSCLTFIQFLLYHEEYLNICDNYKFSSLFFLINLFKDKEIEI